MSDRRWYVTAHFRTEGGARPVYEDLNKQVGVGSCFSVTLSDVPLCKPPVNTPPHVYKRTVTARAIKWTGFAGNIAEVVGFLRDEQSATFLMRVLPAGGLFVKADGVYGGSCGVHPDQWLVVEDGKPIPMNDDEFQKKYQR